MYQYEKYENNIFLNNPKAIKIRFIYIIHIIFHIIGVVKLKKPTQSTLKWPTHTLTLA